jgi:Kef-type K+ transport system membrane component KefB
VLLLMFLAGLELHLTDLAKSGKVSALAGVLGVVFPLALGSGVGLAYSMETASAIFVGLILSATSVSISAQTLMELKVLRSRVGISLLGAAVFDDILVILGLSIFSAVVFSGVQSGLGDVLVIVLRMALFLGAGAAVGILVLPRASARVSRLPISHGLTAFVVVMILLYGWTAEVLGNMAAITGAFLAGLMFARSPVREHIESGITALAFGLFVPIFFIDVGLKANLRELSGESLWFFLAMTLVAVLGKVLGSGLGGWLGGLKRRESLQLGIGMMSRGEVGLIVASVGIASGAIPQDTFSAVVGVVIVTTLLTPPLLRWSFGKKKAPPSKEKPVESQGTQT